MYPALRTNLIRTTLVSLTIFTATPCCAMSSLLSLLWSDEEATEGDSKQANLEQQVLKQTLTSLTDDLKKQNYEPVDTVVHNYLDIQHSSDMLDWIVERTEDLKDPYCLYRYIRNNSMVKRSQETIEGLIFEKTLQSILVHLILIAGDIISCRAMGYKKPAIDIDKTMNDQYLLFRMIYKHWYIKYLSGEGRSFEKAFAAATKWLDDKKGIRAPHPIWVRYVTRGRDRYIGYAKTISAAFFNPDEDEYRACSRSQTIALVDEWRNKSMTEMCGILSRLRTWEDFFKLNLDDLNDETIYELTGKRPSELRLSSGKDSAKASEKEEAEKKEAKSADSQPKAITVVHVNTASSGGSSSGTASAGLSASSSAFATTTLTAGASKSSTLSTPKLGLKGIRDGRQAGKGSPRDPGAKDSTGKESNPKDAKS